MKKRIPFILLIFILILNTQFLLEAQQQKVPKLLVGIVVDQMREEYLLRFYDQFGENGFKRLIREGFNCRNAHYNYIPTVTGPGHSSIYTGTTPRYHGIVNNEWYDRKLKRKVYCVEDTTEKLVGANTIKKGVSPRNLLSSNLADELKISTNQKSKVISVSFKDRSAILPAGHMADGVYWVDLDSGNFISSSFYMSKLPDWVIHFNNQKKAFKYIENTWTLLRPEDSYSSSIAYDNNYEGSFIGKVKPGFPYNLKELSGTNPPQFEVIYTSPFANDLLTDFAIDAIKQEGLGMGNYTDFLAISYSSTDPIGHKFGPLSKEINDTYLRLDEDIARLLDILDKQVGKGNYTLFLTADHGVSDIVKYLSDHKMPTGFLSLDSLSKEASISLNRKFGIGNWIEFTINNQIYLNRSFINEKNINLVEIQNQLAGFLREQKGIAQVFTSNQLEEQDFTQNISIKVQNGFYYKRCGDIIIVSEPTWLFEKKESASHGTGYTYDTHVPIILFGAGIKKGESFDNLNITDLAPTISTILRIKLPSAAFGNIITKAIAE